MRMRWNLRADQSPLLRFFERLAGLLLYLASDGNVHVIDQKGGTWKALTSDAGAKGDRQVICTSPAWSPDGKLVAFSQMTVKGSSEVTDASLFTAGRDGRMPAFVVPDGGDGIDPMFLRDDSLAYVRLMGFDAVTGKTWLIARFPPSKGFFNVLPFFDQYQRSSTIWSSDSRFIGFTALTDQSPAGLFVACADGNIKPRFLSSGDDAFWSSR